MTACRSRALTGLSMQTCGQAMHDGFRVDVHYVSLGRQCHWYTAFVQTDADFVKNQLEDQLEHTQQGLDHLE